MVGVIKDATKELILIQLQNTISTSGADAVAKEFSFTVKTQNIMKMREGDGNNTCHICRETV